MIIKNGVEIKKPIYGTTECTKVIYNGTTVFTKTTGPKIPAGTYYPADFKRVLNSLGMSLGNRKEVKQGTTVRCNGTSLFCSSFVEWARVGWYGDRGPQYICFDKVDDSPYPGVFSEMKHYAVDQGMQPELNSYTSFSITFDGDLIFK